MIQTLLRSYILICLIGAGFAAEAQFSGAVMGEQLAITLEPSFPIPGERITASVDDFSLSSQGATVTWSLNGEAIEEMTNQRAITFTADPDGGTMTLRLTLTSQNGQTMSATRIIKPTYLDIIIEPVTYTPPFYKGRPLPIFGSRVAMTALVHDSEGMVNPNEYTYRWRFNNEVISGGAVRGAHRTVVTIPHGRNIVTAVEVTDSNNQVVARRVINVPSAEIDVQFYEVNPLYGLSTRALQDNHPILTNNTTLYAVPYNLDSYSTQTLNTEWSINGRRAQASDNDPFEINILRDGIGSANIAFKVRNTVQLLQGDEHDVSVSF